MRIFIKNMVSLRCKLIVKDEIERLQLECEDVQMGEAIIKEPVSGDKLKELELSLLKSGLEIVNGKKSKLVEKIKCLVIETIHYSDEPLLENFSTFLARHLNYDYTYLSNLFAGYQGITLQQFILNQKIEKVKELLIYDELTLAEIAHRMNYSSAAHLSKQFKNVTGFTASYYKKLKQLRFDGIRNEQFEQRGEDV